MATVRICDRCSTDNGPYGEGCKCYHLSARETHLSARETHLSAREAHSSARETHLSAREAHLSAMGIDISSRRAHPWGSNSDFTPENLARLGATLVDDADTEPTMNTHSTHGESTGSFLRKLKI